MDTLQSGHALRGHAVLPAVRMLLAVAGLLLAMVGIGIGWDVAGGHRLWPLSEGPLGYRFVASILIAEAVVMGWFAWSLDLVAARGGALGFAAMNAGLAIEMARLHAGGTVAAVTATAAGTASGTAAAAAVSTAGAWAWVCAVVAVGSLGLWWLGGRVTAPVRQPLPSLVRWAFLVFATALGIAVVMLLARARVVFPWPLSPASSSAYGWMFLASCVYFADGFLRPSRANAIGQLAGFLVYDLILIVPWVAHFARASGGFLLSLAIYVAVLTFSGLLAAYYLPRWLMDAAHRGKQA